MSEARERRGSDFTFLLASQHGWKPFQIQQNVVTSTLEAKAANCLTGVLFSILSQIVGNIKYFYTIIFFKGFLRTAAIGWQMIVNGITQFLQESLAVSAFVTIIIYYGDILAQGLFAEIGYAAQLLPTPVLGKNEI